MSGGRRWGCIKASKEELKQEVLRKGNILKLTLILNPLRGFLSLLRVILNTLRSFFSFIMAL